MNGPDGPTVQDVLAFRARDQLIGPMVLYGATVITDTILVGVAIRGELVLERCMALWCDFGSVSDASLHDCHVVGSLLPPDWFFRTGTQPEWSPE